MPSQPEYVNSLLANQITIRLKSKIIYIIRHGQTDYNLKKMVQGRGVDSSLNDTGRLQAREFFEAYKDIDFDKIYTSSLVRTKESVQGFIDIGIPYESLEGLDEISWGDNEGKVYDELITGDYLQGLNEWKTGNSSFRVAGGESPIEVAERQRTAMNYIMSKEEEDVILIATHGRAMRILVCWLMNRPLHDAEGFGHSNLCLYKIKYDGSCGQILIRNSVDHLGNG